MEDQIRKLSMLYKLYKIDKNLKNDYGDERILDDCWKWMEPERVKYKNFDRKNLPVSFIEFVLKYSDGPNGKIFISCKTLDPN